MNLQLPSIGKQIGLLLFIISFSIISVFAIVNSPKTSDYNSITQSTSAEETYKDLWYKVDSLTNIGQAKSALGVIDVIYKKAKVENNSPQFLKAILNQMSRKKQIEENHNVKSISYIKKEIRYSRGSQKAILQSILAELYYKYYTNNRWRINRRTETINFKKTDIATWTTKDLIDAAIKNYKLSLKDVKTLQKISLKRYSIILENENGSKKYRPTLYDFLANRAIDFFRNSISGIIRPAEQFTMNNKDFFLPAKEFTELEIETSDSMSLDFYAINIFQELIKVHAKDKDPSALIDAELNRLQYVKDRSTIEFRDSLYFEGLNNLHSKYKEYSAVTNVAFIIAKHYNSMGAKYNRLAGDKYKWDKKIAIEYCENAIRKFPNSFGAKNCRLLIKDIKTKNLTISNEYANTPNKLSRALINYKNVSDIYFRIVKVDYSKYYAPNKRHGTKLLTDKFLKLKPIKEWSVQLEDDGDFQKHAVEVKLPELELGFYIILLSYEPSFSNNNNQVILSNVWMTNISYISKNSPNKELNVNILHRQTGEGLSGVKVDCYINKYISSKNRRVYTHIGKYISDKNGFVKIQAPNENYQNVFLEFEHNDDEFIPLRNHYIYPYSNTQTRSNTLCHVFTDRAIYRPGQKVYFKAIMLEKTGNNSKILSNYRTEIILLDRNSKAVEKLLLTTNEYGSISGEFTIPKGGLTGRMYISNTFGRQQITVEEYKRPKFELNFKAISGTYKLGEKINITGIAKAYAGNNIDGAKVKYRVVRTARFPYWSYWWRMPRPSSSSVEIENGEMLTDENGEFEISFIAMPDKSVSKSTKPVFNYVIYADVTDMNGETRSSQKTVSVSYTALMLSINIPKIIDVSKNHEFKITTNNFSGQHENTKGEIKIYKLKEPKRVFRNRNWSQADRFLMTQEEYYTNFPNDVYKDENKIYNWPMKKWGYTFSFDSSIDKKLDIKDILNNRAGSYMIEISATDKYGQVVSNKYFVRTFIAESKDTPNYSPHFFFARNKKAEPGDSVSFVIASKEKNLNILYEIEGKDGTVHKEWINLSNEQKVFTIPVTEEFRGNFAYHIS